MICIQAALEGSHATLKDDDDNDNGSVKKRNKTENNRKNRNT